MFFHIRNKNPLTKDWFKLAQLFLEKRIFLISSIYFRYFVIISPLKRGGPFIWTNLNPLHQRLLWAKFGRNWLSGSGEEEFLNFVNVYSPFRYYLPLEKGGGLHLNKLESPSPRDTLYQKFSFNLKITHHKGKN